MPLSKSSKRLLNQLQRDFVIACTSGKLQGTISYPPLRRLMLTLIFQTDDLYPIEKTDNLNESDISNKLDSLLYNTKYLATQSSITNIDPEALNHYLESAVVPLQKGTFPQELAYLLKDPRSIEDKAVFIMQLFIHNNWTDAQKSIPCIRSFFQSDLYTTYDNRSKEGLLISTNETINIMDVLTIEFQTEPSAQTLPLTTTETVPENTTPTVSSNSFFPATTTNATPIPPARWICTLL